jgi:hypothetical protein
MIKVYVDEWGGMSTDNEETNAPWRFNVVPVAEYGDAGDVGMIEIQEDEYHRFVELKKELEILQDKWWDQHMIVEEKKSRKIDITVEKEGITEANCGHDCKWPDCDCIQSKLQQQPPQNRR